MLLSRKQILPVQKHLPKFKERISEKTSEKRWGMQSEWLRSKSLQIINAGEGVEKREPSYTVGGNAN